jgi:hypothetical protein
VAVKLKGKGWNFINIERQLLSPNQWFDEVSDFREGFARVYLKGKGWNLINTEGQLLSPNQWFDYVSDFNEGFAEVRLKVKWCYLDTESNLYDGNKNLIRNLMTESHFYKSSLIENYNKEYKTNTNMAKKQVIRLTESDLHNIIKESVNSILKEAKKSSS